MANATISFTADSTLLEKLTTACCFQYGYKPSLADGTTNPQTPAQFAQQIIIAFCKDVVTAYEIAQATEAAKQQAIAQVQAIINANTIVVTAT